METTLNNGKTYRFEEIFKNYITAYCFYDGVWNRLGVDFENWNEVNAWIEKMNAPVETKPMNYEIPADYYGVRGCYYGD